MSLEKGPFEKESSSSDHQFFADMLVFRVDTLVVGGVNPIIYPTGNNHHPTGNNHNPAVPLKDPPLSSFRSPFRLFPVASPVDRGTISSHSQSCRFTSLPGESAATQCGGTSIYQSMSGANGSMDTSDTTPGRLT